MYHIHISLQGVSKAGYCPPRLESFSFSFHSRQDDGQDGTAKSMYLLYSIQKHIDPRAYHLGQPSLGTCNFWTKHMPPTKAK